jgi:hypothetical protein
MIELNGRYFMPHDFEYEIWKPINGFPNYLFSNFSRVKNIPNKGNKRVMILTPYIHYERTNNIQFQLTRDGKQYKVKVEDLIIAAKFKHIVRIKLHNEDYVRYDKNAEYIYNAF